MLSRIVNFYIFSLWVLKFDYCRIEMLDKISTLQDIYNLASSKYEDNKRRALSSGRPLRYLFNIDFYSVLDYDLGKIAKIILSVVH